MPISSKYHIKGWLEEFADDIVAFAKKGKKPSSWSKANAADVRIQNRKHEHDLHSYIKKVEYNLGETYHAKLKNIKSELDEYKFFVNGELSRTLVELAAAAKKIRKEAESVETEVIGAFKKHAAEIREMASEREKILRKAVEKVIQREKERVKQELQQRGKHKIKKLKTFVNARVKEMLPRLEKMPLAHISSTLPKSFDCYTASSYSLSNATLKEAVSDALLLRD